MCVCVLALNETLSLPFALNGFIGVVQSWSGQSLTHTASGVGVTQAAAPVAQNRCCFMWFGILHNEAQRGQEVIGMLCYCTRFLFLWISEYISGHCIIINHCSSPPMVPLARKTNRDSLKKRVVSSHTEEQWFTCKPSLNTSWLVSFHHISFCSVIFLSVS